MQAQANCEPAGMMTSHSESNIEPQRDSSKSIGRRMRSFVRSSYAKLNKKLPKLRRHRHYVADSNNGIECNIDVQDRISEEEPGEELSADCHANSRPENISGLAHLPPFWSTRPEAAIEAERFDAAELLDARNVVLERHASTMGYPPDYGRPDAAELKSARNGRIVSRLKTIKRRLAKHLPRALITWFNNLQIRRQLSRSRRRRQQVTGIELNVADFSPIALAANQRSQAGGVLSPMRPTRNLPSSAQEKSATQAKLSKHLLRQTLHRFTSSSSSSAACSSSSSSDTQWSGSVAAHDHHHQDSTTPTPTVGSRQAVPESGPSPMGSPLRSRQSSSAGSSSRLKQQICLKQDDIEQLVMLDEDKSGDTQFRRKLRRSNVINFAQLVQEDLDDSRHLDALQKRHTAHEEDADGVSISSVSSFSSSDSNGDDGLALNRLLRSDLPESPTHNDETDSITPLALSSCVNSSSTSSSRRAFESKALAHMSDDRPRRRSDNDRHLGADESHRQFNRMSYYYPRQIADSYQQPDRRATNSHPISRPVTPPDAYDIWPQIASQAFALDQEATPFGSSDLELAAQTFANIDEDSRALIDDSIWPDSYSAPRRSTTYNAGFHVQTNGDGAASNNINRAKNHSDTEFGLMEAVEHSDHGGHWQARSLIQLQRNLEHQNQEQQVHEAHLAYSGLAVDETHTNAALRPSKTLSFHVVPGGSQCRRAPPTPPQRSLASRVHSSSFASSSGTPRWLHQQGQHHRNQQQQLHHQRPRDSHAFCAQSAQFDTELAHQAVDQLHHASSFECKQQQRSHPDHRNHQDPYNPLNSHTYRLYQLESRTLHDIQNHQVTRWAHDDVANQQLAFDQGKKFRNHSITSAELYRHQFRAADQILNDLNWHHNQSTNHTYNNLQQQQQSVGALDAAANGIAVDENSNPYIERHTNLSQSVAESTPSEAHVMSRQRRSSDKRQAKGQLDDGFDLECRDHSSKQARDTPRELPIAKRRITTTKSSSSRGERALDQAARARQLDHQVESLAVNGHHCQPQSASTRFEQCHSKRRNSSDLVGGAALNESARQKRRLPVLLVNDRKIRTPSKLLKSANAVSQQIVIPTIKSDMQAAQQQPLQQPQEQQPQRQRIILQASTSELMRCLSDFLRIRCPKLKHFQPTQVINWLHGVDRTLLVQGWQEIAFINPANVVFLYMLLRELVHENVETEFEMQTIVMTSLYLSYAYMGNEISYPLQPFLCEQDNHENFWDRTLHIINLLSSHMLRLNADKSYFAEVFSELKNFQFIAAAADNGHHESNNHSVAICDRIIDKKTARHIQGNESAQCESLDSLNAHDSRYHRSHDGGNLTELGPSAERKKLISKRNNDGSSQLEEESNSQQTRKKILCEPNLTYHQRTYSIS